MKKLLASLFLLFVCSAAKAETTNRLWFDLHGGNSGSNDGPSLGYKLSYARDQNLFSIGTIAYDTCVAFCFEPQAKVELYLTAGRLYRWRSSVISAQIGLSLVNDYENSQEWIGIPLRLDFTVGKYLGLLAGIHANVSEEQQFVTLNLGFSFGKWH